MLHALAKSATHFIFARIGLGLGESGNFPAAMKSISEWFPKKERAIATGIINSGTAVGVVLALLIVPLILNHYGWHEVFWITGGFGFVWLIFWLIFYDIPSKQKRLSKEEYNLIISGQEKESIREDGKKAIKWLKLFTFLKPELEILADEMPAALELLKWDADMQKRDNNIIFFIAVVYSGSVSPGTMSPSFSNKLVFACAFTLSADILLINSTGLSLL